MTISTKDGITPVRGTHRWQHGLVATLLVTACALVHAQSSEKANAALKLIDQNQCDQAVETINQGMINGEPKSFYIAGQLYGSAGKPVDACKEPAAVVGTDIDAVSDTAVAIMNYPRDAIDRGVTGTVKVRFDPRLAHVTIVSSSDSTGGRSSGGPDRHDFERARLAAQANAIRVLPKPSMSPNVDNSVEREVVFYRKVAIANEPEGLQSLAR